MRDTVKISSDHCPWSAHIALHLLQTLADLQEVQLMECLICSAEIGVHGMHNSTGLHE